MNYNVHKTCAYKLYDPKHMEGDEPMSDYGSYDDEDDDDLEIIAERNVPKHQKKNQKSTKRRVEKEKDKTLILSMS